MDPVELRRDPANKTVRQPCGSMLKSAPRYGVCSSFVPAHIRPVGEPIIRAILLISHAMDKSAQKNVMLQSEAAGNTGEGAFG